MAAAAPLDRNAAVARAMTDGASVPLFIPSAPSSPSSMADALAEARLELHAHVRARRSSDVAEIRTFCQETLESLQQHCKGMGRWTSIAYTFDPLPALITLTFDLNDYHLTADMQCNQPNMTDFLTECQPTVVVQGSEQELSSTFTVPHQLNRTLLVEVSGGFSQAPLLRILSQFSNFRGLRISHNPRLTVRLIGMREEEGMRESEEMSKRDL
jgi:hypothetical protein